MGTHSQHQVSLHRHPSSRYVSDHCSPAHRTLEPSLDPIFSTLLVSRPGSFC
jgi:hypothetical protein